MTRHHVRIRIAHPIWEIVMTSTPRRFVAALSFMACTVVGGLAAQTPSEQREIQRAALASYKEAQKADGFRRILVLEPGSHAAAQGAEYSRLLAMPVSTDAAALKCVMKPGCKSLPPNTKYVTISPAAVNGDSATIVLRELENVRVGNKPTFVGGTISTYVLVRRGTTWTVVSGSHIVS